MSLTVDKNDIRLNHTPNNKTPGQNEAYLILSEEERKKGFVRPVRMRYMHVGKNIDIDKIKYLTAEEKERYKQFDYIGFIPNEDKDSPIVGRYVTKNDLKSGCGAITTMAKEIAETYARNPKFYGSTFCTGCQIHLPVEEFVWYETNIKVGE